MLITSSNTQFKGVCMVGSGVGARIIIFMCPETDEDWKGWALEVSTTYSDLKKGSFKYKYLEGNSGVI